MLKLILIFALPFIFSCSTLVIGSGENIRVTLGDREGHSKDISVPVDIDFFLWGIVPKDYTLKIDEVLMEEGYLSVSNVSVKDNPKFTNFLYTVLTLGFYNPRSFTVMGKINPYQVNTY